MAFVAIWKVSCGELRDCFTRCTSPRLVAKREQIVCMTSCEFNELAAKPKFVAQSNSKCSRLDRRNSNRHQTPQHGSPCSFGRKRQETEKSARMTSTYEYIQEHTSHTSTYKYIAAESLRDMLVESLVRGCTSWSKTIATPLIPAVNVRAKALSMGSFPKSAPMFHWLFAWSKDCIFHGPQHSLLACLEGPSTTSRMFHRHV